MEVNNISGHVGEDGALPSVAQFIRILLVDHDTTSLKSLTSQFEQELYKVTTTESASVALSSFMAQKNYYDIVIADRHMPEMNIYEFVHELHRQRMNIPVILIAEDLTTELAEEAIGNGVCYIFSKPPSHRDIATLWQHIYRVTGKMPSSTDSNYFDREKYGNPSSGSSCDVAARNQKQSNSNRKMINTNKENIERRKTQIAEDLNSSNDTDKDGGRNPKKSHMTWTFSLHKKFLQAINIIGEHGAKPNTLLRMLNEPGLTLRHVNSHLQKYRDRKRRSVNLQKTASPVMPTVLPAAPMSIQGQTFGAANLNYMEARGAAPNFVGYCLDSVKEKMDALNYSGYNTTNAIITNGGIQIPEGSGGVQIAQGIVQNRNTNQNPSANIGEQAQVFPRSYGHSIPASDHLIPANGHNLSNGLQAPNHEPARATVDMIPSSRLMNNGLQGPSQEPAGATGDVILASGHLSNGLQALNQESAGDFGMGMYGLGNTGNPANMNNYIDTVGEGTTANQQFDGMPSNDDI